MCFNISLTSNNIHIFIQIDKKPNTKNDIDISKINPINDFINVKEDNISSENLNNYTIKNVRELCITNNKKSCNINPHCIWSGNSCLYNTYKVLYKWGQRV